ncbi:alpha/beta hydrolase [candidate division WWE3 bacterium]|uniref:Alpha/beta hydrolase n=1 Tax=candidate division WWE3 bacterium TaxID=2053526 RepID=A0A955LVL0_UNCKA|nr:alpha/beta hydrolase [candidate division WWE3 bacterium]
MKEGIIPVDNGELYYQLHGSGTPIVFLHGFSLDHRMWNEQVKHFSNNYQTITYDLRGFGQSSLPNKPYSHFDDVHSLLTQLNIEEAHIVGLSMGGEAAIDFALAYPNKLVTLTLIDSSLGGFPCPVDWNVHAKEVGLEQAKQNWLNHEVFQQTRKNKDVTERIQEMINNYSGWKWLNDDPRLKLTPSAMERVHEINVPTLILVGEKDLPYFHDTAKYIHQQIEKSVSKFIPQTGHMANMENPTFVNTSIENLITGHT